MRSTIGTVSVVAVLLIVAFAFSPSPPNNGRLPLSVVNAQGADAPVAAAAEKSDKDFEKMLDSKTVNVQFQDTPLNEALAVVGELLEMDILLDPRVNELGIAGDSPVTLMLNKRAVRVRTALELILQRVSPELDFSVRDGVLVITGPNASFVTEVYNIAGLLPDVKVAPAAPQNAQGSGDEPFGQQLPPADQLRQVITSTIAPSSWSETGGTGAANVFATLLVIKNSPQAHREIRALLTMMEKTLQEGKGATKK